MDWVMWKQAVVDWTGLSRDALHVTLALAVFLGILASGRGRLPGSVAWAATFTLELANESVDLLVSAGFLHALDLAGSLHDVAVTMLLPTTAVVATALMRRPVRRRRRGHRPGCAPQHI